MPDTCSRVSRSEAESTRNARSAWQCRVRRALASRPLIYGTTENARLLPTARHDDVKPSELRLRARAPPRTRLPPFNPFEASGRGIILMEDEEWSPTVFRRSVW